MDLVNLTPFAVNHTVGMDGAGLERLVVVVKATFAWSATSVLQLAEQQAPAQGADVYRAEPASSSLAAACELGLPRPATDVLFTGSAHGGGARAVAVGLKVGRVNKTAHVVGNRHWERALGVVRPSPAERFDRLPLTWERAFGGSDTTVAPAEGSIENPAGVGFRGRGSRRPIVDQPLPNLEAPGTSILTPDDRPAPIGFGPVAPSWACRRRYAGTLDARWRERRAPLLPDDFDARFFQAAPVDQIYPGYVAGGEPIALTGVSARGPIAFALPKLHPRVSAKLGRAVEELPARCDVVAIDADRATLALIFRASLPVQGRLAQLTWIRVGQA